MPLCGNVVGLEIKRETRVGKVSLLARRGIQGDFGPSSEILIGTRCWSYGERVEIVEGLSIDRVDSRNAFLDNVKQYDRLVE